MKKNINGGLMLKSFIFTWITWLAVYYISYLLLQRFSTHITNPKIYNIYSTFFLDISGGEHAGMFASWPSTFFGISLLFFIGWLYRKFYYKVHMKK